MTDTEDHPRGYTWLQMWPAILCGAVFAALMFFAPVILTGGSDEPASEKAPVVEESSDPIPAELLERFQPSQQPAEQLSNSWID